MSTLRIRLANLLYRLAWRIDIQPCFTYTTGTGESYSAITLGPIRRRDHDYPDLEHLDSIRILDAEGTPVLRIRR